MEKGKAVKKSYFLMAALIGILIYVLFMPHNVSAYSRCAFRVKSYLAPQSDGSLLRVEGDIDNKNVYAEYYDQNMSLLKALKVKLDLPIFGAFYSDGNYNYVLTGQNNPNESDNVEVYRITKYDQNWNVLGSCGLKGANTYEPFNFGSARMTSSGKYLVIRTCHTMYAEPPDELHHQANVTIEVDTDAMQITDSYTAVMNDDFGYVSHSFNQFVRIDGTHIVGVDHGDAFPRAVVLCKYTNDVTTGKLIGQYLWDENPCDHVEMLPISGETGNNTTGVTVGGFEISSDRYIVVGTSIDQNHFTTSKTENIFVSSIDRNLNGKPEVTYLTHYSEGSASANTPFLVKINDDRFVILWSRDDHDEKINYAELDAKGHIKGNIHTMPGIIYEGRQPVVYNDNIVWIPTTNSISAVWYHVTPVLYKINTKQLNQSSSQNLKQPMYRLYNKNSGEHFYTSKTGERDHLISLGWRNEWIGWFAPVVSTTPVYRLYNKNSGDHHYTANVKERDHLVKIGWKDEGIGWYSSDSKTVPLYRQYNPNAKSGAHNYTQSKAENNALVKAGWREEGIGWYGTWEF